MPVPPSFSTIGRYIGVTRIFRPEKSGVVLCLVREMGGGRVAAGAAELLHHRPVHRSDADLQAREVGLGDLLVEEDVRPLVVVEAGPGLGGWPLCVQPVGGGAGG